MCEKLCSNENTQIEVVIPRTTTQLTKSISTILITVQYCITVLYIIDSFQQLCVMYVLQHYEVRIALAMMGITMLYHRNFLGKDSKYRQSTRPSKSDPCITCSLHLVQVHMVYKVQPVQSTAGLGVRGLMCCGPRSADGRDRKSTRLNSSHSAKSRMPSSA